ncbi:hypothetical protein LVJ59_17675 [Microbacterium sp. KKR3/1]|uniref:hypothetical protein n=1 Tax=Microbacterium sp. KKR3/1 TaxID=2904241 RepID=UPI001E467984|nr:hypothetical protein [Microbacterium sp. KKR3/1]MCE0510880.1 hypothetical protein [Microbacterium sp. KKR3/1]
MTANSIPPLPVERADTRPVRIVPLHDTRAWATFITITSGTIGALAGGWFVYGLVIVNG